MKLLRSLFLMSCAGLALVSVHATTVIPPTFDQLVSDAEFIFQGTVTDTRSQWMGEGAQRHIVTLRHFQGRRCDQGRGREELHHPHARRDRG